MSNDSDPQYQAMFTTRPREPTDFIDTSTTASTPFDYATSSDTDADNATLPSARRWAWYCKEPACPGYWSSWSCKSIFWLHLHETSVHKEDAPRTHTRVGRRELAREWRVETDWEMKEPKQPRSAPRHNGTALTNGHATNRS